MSKTKIKVHNKQKCVVLYCYSLCIENNAKQVLLLLIAKKIHYPPLP